MWIEGTNGNLANTDVAETIIFIDNGIYCRFGFSVRVCGSGENYIDIAVYSTEESARLAIKKISFALKKNQKFFTMPTEKELNKKPEKEKETVSKKEPCMSFTEAINLWNTLADKGYKQVSKRGKDTQQGKMLEARLIQYTKEEWERAIENIRKSDYLPKATWFDFDWFIKPSNFPKVLDGNYNTAEDRIDTNEKAWWDE